MVLVEVTPSLSMFFSVGVVTIGMASWLGGGDETDVEEVEDDEFAMDDDFAMDDFDDDFGGMGDGEEGSGAGLTELEHRLEDLESEIANVSSTANTVRSENEQISEKVDDVEENVRKLLEIYEMVTRGVNPFVDDVSTEAGLGGDGGSFGLFDEEGDDADAPEEDLDSDIADAEAEDFFDDEAFDDFDDEFEEESADDLEEPSDGIDEPADEFAEQTDDLEEPADDALAFDEADDLDGGDAPTNDGADGTDADGESGGGTSFEELKAEYESGEADWADEDVDDSGATETADDRGAGTATDTTESEGPSESDGDVAGEDDPPDLFIEDDLTAESEPASERDVADDGASHADTESADDSSAGGFEFGATASTSRGERPYLERPPDGYLADVVVFEWLDYLLEAYDARNAIRAINYYERIGWIGEPMRDHCVEMLCAITDAEYVYRDEFGSTDVTMADHKKSLAYVEELAGGRLDRSIADRFDTREGDGI